MSLPGSDQYLLIHMQGLVLEIPAPVVPKHLMSLKPECQPPREEQRQQEAQLVEAPQLALPASALGLAGEDQARVASSSHHT
jgi:hypothetical protein